MTEDRLARIEAELEKLKPSLSDRLEKLEKTAAEKPSGRWQRFSKWMGPALPTLITSIVMLVLGYWIKDSVDIAIKQQTLQLSYVKEMKEQLVAMATESDPDAVKRAAVVIAAFGEPALLPLMNELRFGGNRELGAVSGLSALAFMHPQAVCGGVMRVLKSPTQPLSWEGHAAAAQTLAAANCSEALPVLQAHVTLLAPVADGGTVDVTQLIADNPTVSQQKEWLRRLKQSVARLSAAAKRGA